MIFGADFSSLDEAEALGARYRLEGQERELVSLLAGQGVSFARLRLWVEPRNQRGESYGGGGCDLECVKRLAKRAKEAGMGFLLDLHYSDFWCDPGRQLTPLAWRGLELPELCGRLYEYTKEVLTQLRAAGLEPDMVQVGNEITNGMLWPVGRLTEPPGREGFDHLAALLRAGVRAVRECSGARVMLHLENSGNCPLWQEWFDEMLRRGVEFDLIGASYYPYWHGAMEELRSNLSSCARRYGREIYIVETAYPFTTEPCPNSQGAALCICDGARRANGSPVEFPLTPQGQRDFLMALFRLVESLPGGLGAGVFYWEPGWLPVEGVTWATEAALQFMGEEEKAMGNEWANQCLFDYNGQALPALDAFCEFSRMGN